MLQAYMAKLMVRPVLPNHLRNLVRQARMRGVGLQIMPASMQRRKENSSVFSHKDKVMLWRVELVFHADAGQRLFLDKIPDTTPVAALLARLVDPARGTENAASRAQLPATARLGAAGLRLLVRVEPSLANAVSPGRPVCGASTHPV